MKVEIKRTLENKVFKSIFKRVIAHDDSNLDAEKKAENDFGPVKISTGGVVDGFVDIVNKKIVVSENTGTRIKFNVKGSIISLVQNAEFSYSVDAKGEVMKDSLTSLQVAEGKCKLYEKFIEKAINESVSKWQEQFTTFETDEVLAIEKDLIPEA